MMHPNPNDRLESIAWAKAMLNDVMAENVVILDTETTGLGEEDEIVQLGIIDARGTVLFNSLIRPEGRTSIPREATAVHGITMAMLANAPTFRDMQTRINELTRGKVIVAYNAEYDERLFDQTCTRYRVPRLKGDWQCAMKQYARFVGEWNTHFDDYRWQKLPSAAHGAIGDCQATLKIMRDMATAQLVIPDSAPMSLPVAQRRQSASDNILGKMVGFGCLGLVGIVILFAIIGAMVNGNKPTDAPETSPSTSYAPTPTQTVDVIELSGDSEKRSEPFTLQSGQQHLSYSVSGAESVLCFIYVVPEGKSLESSGGTPEVTIQKPMEDSTILVKSPGRYYLDVTAVNCTWSLKITEDR